MKTAALTANGSKAVRPTRLQWMKAAVLAASALFIGSAAGQQSGLQSYDVELVVFRNLASNASAEDWSQESGLTQNSPAADDEEAVAPTIVETPATALETFPALPAGKMKLTAIADSLKRSRGYQPLAHFGWTQPGFPRSEAHYMSIDGLVNAGTDLTGRVALSRGRYLHLTLDLVLQPSGSNERYVLRQTRRMRSNERHYIDHPKLGVIAVITPSETNH